jgi:hypothetical protein
MSKDARQISEGSERVAAKTNDVTNLIKSSITRSLRFVSDQSVSGARGAAKP